MKHLFFTIPAICLLAACTDTQPASEPSLMEASKQELVSALQERDQLLADMAQAKETLNNRRLMLADLQARLQTSTAYADDLSTTIDDLRGYIDSQSRQIRALQDKLAYANTQIGNLSSDADSLSVLFSHTNQALDNQEQTSAFLENKLNTCYYAIGSKSLLNEHKIIETRFLRSTKILQGDFDQSMFAVADKRNLSVIDLHSPKAKIYTIHPEDSYSITKTDKNKILTITDPARFWAFTNYLIIQTD